MTRLSLGSIPTITQLYRSSSSPLFKSASKVKDTVNAPSQAFNDTISLVREDVTTLDVDAIVNAANSSLMGGGGVDGAIHRAAGPNLKKECAKLKGCETGSAKMTQAYELPCRHVIHAVGPVYGSASAKKKGGHAKLLAGCYRTALELARDSNLRSIAFSAISTGVYGYPSTEAAEVVLATAREFLEETSVDSNRIERIVFCNFTEKDEQAYERNIPKYFPPTSEDTEATASDSNGNDGESLAQLAKQLPDVPTEEPKEPEPEGAPAKKRVKMSAQEEGGVHDFQEENSDEISTQDELDEDENGSGNHRHVTDQETGMTQAVDGVHLHSQDAGDDHEPYEADGNGMANQKPRDELPKGSVARDGNVVQPRQGEEQTVNPA